MQVRLTAGTLPPSTCITDLQEFVNQIFANAYGTLDTTASIAKVIVSEQEPSADQRDYLWIRINPSTHAYDKAYNYLNGYWISPHAIAPSSGVRQIWEGDPADIATLDGGSSGTVGDATGPMWEIALAFAGRMPIGVGTLSGAGTAIASGSTGGADQTTIARANLPADKLTINTKIVGQAGVGSDVPVVGSDYGSEAIGGSGKAVDSTTDSDLTNRYYAKMQSEAMGSGAAMNTISPYYGVYFLKRTSRKYYVPQ